MRRLTERDEGGTAFVPDCLRIDTCGGSGMSEKCGDCPYESELIEELARYEDTGLAPYEIEMIVKIAQKGKK